MESLSIVSSEVKEWSELLRSSSSSSSSLPLDGAIEVWGGAGGVMILNRSMERMSVGKSPERKAEDEGIGGEPT
jgi:hypothetical protein